MNFYILAITTKAYTEYKCIFRVHIRIVYFYEPCKPSEPCEPKRPKTPRAPNPEILKSPKSQTPDPKSPMLERHRNTHFLQDGGNKKPLTVRGCRWQKTWPKRHYHRHNGRYLLCLPPCQLSAGATNGRAANITCCSPLSTSRNLPPP